LDGVTSAIQTQITDLSSNKQDNISLTASRALVSDESGTLAVSNNVTSTELGYLDGVTSAIQTQINDLSSNKQDNISLTASRALVSDGTGNLIVSDITSTELGYLDDVTSAIQSQLDGKQATLTFGIANTNAVRIDSTTVADGSFVLFTANGIDSIDASNMTFALFDQTDISDVPSLVSSDVSGAPPTDASFNDLRQDVQNLKGVVNTLMGLLNTANIITRQS
jgi:hypothetical protein